MTREEFLSAIAQCNKEKVAIEEKKNRIANLYRLSLEEQLLERGIVDGTRITYNGKEYYYAGLSINGTFPFFCAYTTTADGKITKRKKTINTLSRIDALEKV